MRPEPNTPDSNAPRRDRNVQVWPLVTTSVRRCWAARDEFLCLGILPVTLLVLVTSPLHDLMEEFRRAEALGQSALVQAMSDAAPEVTLLNLCLTATYCLFAVNWVRLMTLGPAAVNPLGLSIGIRHLRLFAFMVAIAVVTAIAALLLAFLLLGFGATGILTALVFGTVLWIGFVLRLSPRWIGMAIDAPMPMAIAWKRTRGQGIKLFLALLLIEIPALVAEQVVGIVFQLTGLIAMAPYTFFFLICSIEMVRLAVQLGALLAAYPQFVRETV